MKTQVNSCYNCKFLHFNDQGYSNWTVTDTETHCLRSHFECISDSYPQDKDAEFYKQAESCPDYLFSDVQARFDVDGETTEEDYQDDPILYKALKKYYA